MSKGRIPPYEAFVARAKEITRSIPAEYLEGVEDVVVHREVKRHPLIEDVVTLGECEPSALVAMTAHEQVRSIVHLYYGSFADLASRDPRFDADAELQETIRHEIQHHLEDRAGVRTLIDEDDLFDAHQRFLAGLENPAGWWRRGDRLDRDVYAVGQDLFVELRVRRPEFERLRGSVVPMTVLGEPFEPEIPADAAPGEILTFDEEGLLPDEEGAGGAHGHAHGARPRAEGGEEGADEEAPGALHLVLDVR